MAKDADEYIKAYDVISGPDKSALEVGYSDVNPGTIANWCRIFLQEKAALLSSSKPLDNYQSALLISRFATVSVETRTGNTENERQKTLIKYPQLIAARITLFSDLQASRKLTAVVSSTQEIEDADKVLQHARVNRDWCDLRFPGKPVIAEMDAGVLIEWIRAPLFVELFQLVIYLGFLLLYARQHLRSLRV